MQVELCGIGFGLQYGGLLREVEQRKKSLIDKSWRMALEFNETYKMSEAEKQRILNLLKEPWPLNLPRTRKKRGPDPVQS